MIFRGPFYAPDDGGTGGGGNPGGGGGGADPGTGGGQPWYTGKVDQETIGHWQNRNWNVNDPAALAVEATRAWRAAEANVGVPADRLLRLPADMNDAAAMRAVRERLGAPADVAGYDFSGVKYGDGTALEADLVTPLSNTFHKLGISKSDAVEITRALVSWADGMETAENAEVGATRAVEMARLQANWGQNFQMNRLVAQQAAAKLGLPQEAIDALDNIAGMDRVMEMFRQIGVQMGEASWVPSGNGAGNTPQAMTAEQAVARIAELKRDPEWTKKYLAGDAGARRELANLQVMKLGGINNDGVSGIPASYRPRYA